MSSTHPVAIGTGLQSQSEDSRAEKPGNQALACGSLATNSMDSRQSKDFDVPSSTTVAREWGSTDFAPLVLEEQRKKAQAYAEAKINEAREKMLQEHKKAMVAAHLRMQALKNTSVRISSQVLRTAVRTAVKATLAVRTPSSNRKDADQSTDSSS